MSKYCGPAGLVILALVAGCGPGEPVTPTASAASPTSLTSPTATVETLAPGDTRMRPTDDMVMVYVPPGTFQMGSTGPQVEAAMELCAQYPDPWNRCELSRFEVEAPQHAVTLDGFWIDRTEVTNAQYARCVESGSCTRSRLADDPTYNHGDCPVAGVPWQDAAAYCAWAGGRLPTEAEWEYAARGTQGAIYPWGDAFDCAAANLEDSLSGCDDGYPGPAPVGSFDAGISWCGALDMAGNVWEWVADAFGQYPAEMQANPAGPAVTGTNILRGGSWGYPPAFVRTAHRYAVPPEADYLAVGFRCAVSYEQ
jgi:formylglycine-generating enzyme required for sulfatase activity